jgi:PhzF family phenazine biosynthesis protein
MDDRTVRLVDALADEPFGGVPVPVVGGDSSLTDTQCRAVARECGATGAVACDDSRLRYVGAGGPQTPLCGAVAGGVGLLSAGELEPGEHTVVDADHGREYTIAVEADRRVAVDVPEQSVDSSPVEREWAAESLGIDPTAVRAVESLPVSRVEETLVVPVSYLEHLTRASPDKDALVDLLARADRADVARVLAFTFDTLVEEADVHARIFDPAATGNRRATGNAGATDSEVAASGVAAGACGAYLAAHGAFDGDREVIGVESGHVLDRPARLTTTVTETPRVAGSGLVAVEGTLTVPETESDDIVEL